MTRPKRRPIQATRAQENAGEKLDDVPGTDEQILGEILDAFNEGGADEQWRIYVYRDRASANTPKDVFLFQSTIDDLQDVATKIRDEFGTGSYRVRVYRGRELYKNLPFFVEGKAKTPTPAATTIALADPVLNALRENNELLRQVIQQRPAPDNENIAQQFAAIAGAMKDIMPARAEPAAALEATTVLDILNKGMEIGRKTVSSGEPDTLGTIAAALAPMAANFLQRLQPQQRQPAPAQQNRPAIAYQQPQAKADPNGLGLQFDQAPASQQLDEQQQQQQNFAEVMNLCVRGASRGSDARIFADVCYEDLPLEAIAWIIQQPNPVQAIGAAVPDVLMHAQWFFELVNELKAIHELEQNNREPGGADGDTGRNGGDSRNTQAYEGDRAGGFAQSATAQPGDTDHKHAAE